MVVFVIMVVVVSVVAVLVAGLVDDGGIAVNVMGDVDNGLPVFQC